jgi:glutamate carboxypeptidase
MVRDRMGPPTHTNVNTLPHALLEFCESELPWQLETIRALVGLESPSDDPTRLAQCAAELAQRLASIGGAVSGLDDDTSLHVRGEFGSGTPRVLLLGHLDTVWPVGALEIDERDGALYGPGVYDMKAGLAIGLQAVRALRAHDALTGSVVFLCTTDEEIGSGHSRPLIEREARSSDAVLVLEPALASGGVKTGRKGVGDYRVEVTGVSAHAGVEPGRGASAVHELVRQAGIVMALGRPELGTTVNVGVVTGGTRSNVVAEHASMAVDVRVESTGEASRVESAMTALRPADSRIAVTVLGGVNRPAMERSGGVLRLYEEARAVAKELGRDLAEGTTGGASDGNFTAALGVPTLDGLGAIGDGAHARHEHVLIEPLAFRTALLAGLMARLGRLAAPGTMKR